MNSILAWSVGGFCLGYTARDLYSWFTESRSDGPS